MTITADSPIADKLDDKQLRAMAERFLVSGGTFKDLKGLTEENMEAIYSVAHNLYQNGKFDEAQKVFQFLCFFDHFQKRHWMGLAACRQMIRNYQGAVEAYSFATMLDVNDPKPPFLAADSHLGMGNYKAAASALHAAIEFSGGKPEYKSIRERAQARLELIGDKAGDDFAPAAKADADARG